MIINDDTITIDGKVVNGNSIRSYYEQADEPLTAVSGDVWRDTDTGVIATLYIDGTNRIWMEF